MRTPQRMKKWLSRCRDLLTIDVAAAQLKLSVFFRLNHRAITTALFFAVLSRHFLSPLSAHFQL